MPFLVNEVNQYASARHMRLNPKKCKEMRTCFLKYRSPIGGQLLIGGHQVDLVKHFKLLGVYMSHDLTWNKHVGYITKKGFKRLYILRQLKIAGISDKDLVLTYISLIQSVLEYAAPVWANSPQYLSDDIESVQRRALKIIFPDLDYFQVLESSKLLQLSNRRDRICESFMVQQRKSSSVLSKIINTNYEPKITPSYSLRSQSRRLNNVQTIVRTNRFSQFVTNKF
jgi:hypothetical protein